MPCSLHLKIEVKKRLVKISQGIVSRLAGQVPLAKLVEDPSRSKRVSKEKLFHSLLNAVAESVLKSMPRLCWWNHFFRKKYFSGTNVSKGWETLS
jgi:hypothetical protein